jgi:hypothetical protein
LGVQNGKTTMRSEHRKHDRLLVTRYAMDDAYPSERDEARLLIESCADCSALAADMRQISSSVGQLPAPARTRDFMITAEKAEELRGSRLSRWMRSFASPRWGTLRPVAGVALSIGLVMAVVGTALPATLPAAAPEGGVITLNSTDEPAFAPGPAAPAAPETSAPALGAPNEPAAGDPPPGDRSNIESASQAPVSAEFDQAYTVESPQPLADGEVQSLRASQPRDTSRDLLVWTGLLIAVISFVLLALAWLARRYFADPLLR